MQLRGNMPSRFSNTSEDFASELLNNIEGIIPRYSSVSHERVTVLELSFDINYLHDMTRLATGKS